MTRNELPDDPTLLLERFRQGDERAFRVLYDRYFPMLFLIIREYVGQREVAEDIVTNAFIKLYNHRMKIRDGDHVKGFLFVVARNEAAGHYREQRRRRVAREAQERLADREYHDPRETELEREEWMRKIREVIGQLPPARRQIFELHFFKGLSIREIANQLNLTETTVRNQRNRALRFLRQAFCL